WGNAAAASSRACGPAVVPSCPPSVKKGREASRGGWGNQRACRARSRRIAWPGRLSIANSRQSPGTPCSSWGRRSTKPTVFTSRPPEPSELAASRGIVAGEQVAPPLVAELGGEAGRVDDVGEYLPCS